MAQRVPGLAYRVSNVLYLSLTNKVVGGASSLVAQRGPGYRLPASSGFQMLADDAQVTPEAVDAAVDAANNMEEGGLLPFGTVFAGHVGDPLLEMDTLERSIELVLEKRRGMALGILTSGAFDVSVAERLCTMRQRLKIETISATVNLAAPDPMTYAKVTGGQQGDFQKACTFVSTLTENGFPVIGLAVEHPAVRRKLRALKQMSTGLGTTRFLQLPYYATTLYDTLGVDDGPAASSEEIKKAFRKLSFEFHPDQAAQTSTEEEAEAVRQRYDEIVAAYEVLSDRSSRELYDDFGVGDFSTMDHGGEHILLLNPKTGHSN